MNKLSDILRRAGRLLWLPVSRQWMFILITGMLLAPVCVFGVMKAPLVRPSLVLDFEGLLRGFFYAYLLAAIVVASRWRPLRWVFYFAALLICVTAATVNSMFKLDITPRALVLLAETNNAEAVGFFTSFFGPKMCLGFAAFVIGMAAIVLADRFTLPISHWLSRLYKGIPARVVKVAAVVALCGGGFYAVRSLEIIFSGDTIESIEARNPGYHCDNVTKILFSVRSIVFMSNDTNRWLARVRADWADPALAADTLGTDTLDIVVIVGESYIRRHAQLYGYPLPTTPRLSAEARAGRLVRFDSARSSFDKTSVAMRSLLSLGSQAEGEPVSRSTFWPLLFRKAGWDIYMLDNQHADDGNIFSFTLNSFLYAPFIADSCYTYMSKFADFNDDMAFLARENPSTVPGAGASTRRLWIYHIWGQHIDPATRFPDTPENKVFGPDDYAFRREPWLDESRRSAIADYDNATLYNDRVVARILAMHSGRPTVAFYFSDHGDEAYDYRDAVGRVGVPADPALAARYDEAIHDIPFMIWFSDSYLEAFPAQVEEVRGAALRRLDIDHLGYPLLRLAGISSPRYDASRDFLATPAADKLN